MIQFNGGRPQTAAAAAAWAVGPAKRKSLFSAASFPKRRTEIANPFFLGNKTEKHYIAGRKKVQHGTGISHPFS